MYDRKKDSREDWNRGGGGRCLGFVYDGGGRRTMRRMRLIEGDAVIFGGTPDLVVRSVDEGPEGACYWLLSVYTGKNAYTAHRHLQTRSTLQLRCWRGIRRSRFSVQCRLAFLERNGR